MDRVELIASMYWRKGFRDLFNIIFKTSSFEENKKKQYKVDRESDQHIKLQDVPSGIMYLLVW